MCTKISGLCCKIVGVVLRDSERTVLLVNDIHMNRSCSVVRQLDLWSLLVVRCQDICLVEEEYSSGFLVMQLWMLFQVDKLYHSVTHHIHSQWWGNHACDTECWCPWHMTGLARIHNFFKLWDFPNWVKVFNVINLISCKLYFDRYYWIWR